MAKGVDQRRFSQLQRLLYICTRPVQRNEHAAVTLRVSTGSETGRLVNHVK
jgi:hypothetical protein